MEQNMTPHRRIRPAKKHNGVRYALIALIILVLVAAVLIPVSYLAGELTLVVKGDSVITLEFGQQYQDPGVDVNYTALFSSGNTSDVRVETNQQVNPQKLGEYTITYTAFHKGKVAKAERTVRIVDTQKPTISLVYNTGSVTLPGQPYVEEGFAAEDNYDGDITDRVQRIVEGDTIIYRVTDSSGNTAQVTRQIRYGDFTAPELTLKGDAAITISAGLKFEDPGFTATDNLDGDITDKVAVSKDHSIYLPGTYTITYTVTDSHGNTATATRTLIVEAAKQPDVVEPNGKVIYLTFDDGPSKYTLDLLKILDKYNVKATFFVVGTAGISYLDEIVDAGHAIAIHSASHDYKTIYTSKEAFFDDLFNMQNIIYERTGTRTTLMRFPGGSSNTVSRKYCKGIMTELAKAVEAQGFQYFDWNVDSRDASDALTEDAVFNNVINGVKNYKYSVVLQHDIKGYSVQAVDRIIAWGLANGYTFLPLDSTSPTAHHDINN